MGTIHTLRAAAAIAFLLAVQALNAQTIVYVNAAAPTDGDGTSWPTARKYLNPALADAAALANTGHTVQVWIAAGIYLPDQSPSNPNGGTVDGAYFPLHNSVSLFGGFTGSETSLNQADPATNYTGLHGFNNTVTGLGSLRVIVGSNVNASVVVDGIAVTNARYLDGGGKAIRLSGSSSTFRRCTIHDTRNNGTHAPTVWTAGGSPVFEDCLFSRNKAGAPDAHGGAIYCNGGSLTIRRCVFERNSADGMGGAIYQIPGGGPLLVEDCVFRDNSSNDMWGGAMWLAANSIVRRCTFEGNHSSYYSIGALGTAGRVEDCLFVGNYSGMQGGAVAGGTYVNCEFIGNHSDFGGGAASGEATFTNCRFSGNRARYGGAIYGGGTIRGCTFSDNRASAGDGGGGGALYLNADALVQQCNFLRNTATGSGAVFGGGRIENCVFISNFALDDYSETAAGAAAGADEYVGCVFVNNSGRAVHSGAVHINNDRVVNCTFYNNVPHDLVVRSNSSGTVINSIFYRSPDATVAEDSHIYVLSTSSATVTTCFLQGLGPRYAGNSNIGGSRFLSPRFADPDGPDDFLGTLDDDVRLLPGSPCIDAGDSTAVPAGLLTDAAGDPRFFDDPGMPDAGSLTAPVVDMGAYEFQATSCLADANGNGFLDGDDADFFTTMFHSGDPAADLNRDGFTDGIDHDLFHNALEAGCP